MKNLRKEFINFLKANNALIPFVTNLACNSSHTLTITGGIPEYHPKRQRNCELTLSEYINRCSFTCLISNAFLWRKTSEGHAHWHKLSEKWVNKFSS